MTARRFCNVVHSMLLEGHTREEVDEMLHGKKRWRETLPAEEIVWEEVA